MAYIAQPLPAPNHPFLTKNGTIDPIWYQFIKAIFQRTGGASGSSASGNFIYPDGMGTTGQYLQSQGDGQTPTWYTLDSVSQLTNDADYVTSDELSGYAKSDSAEFTGSVTLDQASNATLGDQDLTTAGWVRSNTVASVCGLKGEVTLDDLVTAGVAPLNNPVFTGNLQTSNVIFSNTFCVIISGSGAPTANNANGSLYLNTAGGTGTRLYVSHGGGTWTPISGV